MILLVLGTLPRAAVLASTVRNGTAWDSAEARSLDAYPLAKCLDGSPARYYLSKGNASRVFVFFEGGGFCQNLSDCQARAASYLGSTSQDPPSLVLDRPYFSRSPAASPLLSSFTIAYVRYCDGGYYSGDRASPVAHNGSRLHFRGRRVLEAVFADLRLDEAAEVIVGGCSAGAIHVLAHLDAMRAMLPSAVRLTGLADSGFYMDNYELFTHLKRFVVAPSGQNATALLSPECAAAFHTEPERCLAAQRGAPFLQTPTFVWQSRFDLDQRSCELTPKCSASSTCVQSYARSLSSAIHEQLLARRHGVLRAHGAFIDVCERHCDDGVRQMHNLTVDGATPLQAFALWYGTQDQGTYTHTPNRTAHEINHSRHPRTLWEMPGGQAAC